ncbi:DUF5675 family protein [Parapedobacter sp. 2B3]|uniref:DUF5675 family protein n=1 Tax=Parapedobacter sp. 2B3 TaxID=3342381 RepID=UPI0035B5F504
MENRNQQKGCLTLVLERGYLPQGTNGTLFLYGKPICHTIELPWRNNRRNVSCIPEGRYRLARYRSRRFGNCLVVEGVRGRRGILMHPANDASTELQGCIAPVTKLTGEGKGIYSRVALERLEREVMGVLEEGEEVWLEVSGCRTASAYCVR